MPRRFFVILLFFLLIAGCSTRQVIPELDGSTAQRLVTHSIDHLMQQIPEEDFALYGQKKIYVQPHFIKEAPLYSYATERFKMELSHRFACLVTPVREDAEFVIDLFFTSLGTEHDIFGFSIPFLVIPGYSAASDINLLAIEMFHGISEMYYYLSDSGGHVLLRREKTKASVRTDKLALPIITIPINTMD
ncbi:MAG: hypothetical protein IMY82_03900 [Chloroflexi bacterium]|nr:hypothetical protein [Chloroflexota bacterium]